MAPGKVHSTAKNQKNPVVERCFKLLTSKPSSPKALGKPRPGGRKKRYSGTIPNWITYHKKGDTYYRIAVRDGIFELHAKDRMPSKLHRDPTSSEATILIKRYGSKLVRGNVDNCGKEKCGHALYYRLRKQPQPKPSKIDYGAVIRKYRQLIDSTSGIFSAPLPSTAEFAAVVKRYERIEAYRLFRKALPRQIRTCSPTMREFKSKLHLIEEMHKEYQLAEDIATDWLTVETTTKPIIEEIKNYYMPDPDSLSPSTWRYLRKQIYIA